MPARSKEISRAAASGFAWGFAEAIFFFIVPDVLLCYWAMKGARQAVVATIAVVVGAMTGACVLYAVAHAVGPTEMTAFFHKLWSHLPGFRAKMALVAHAHLEHGGAIGLLSGPSSGIPYRVYVVEAIRLQLGLGKILFWTPIARLERIVIAPLVVLALRAMFQRFGLPRAALAGLIILYWIGLYVWYWGSLVPGVYGG